MNITMTIVTGETLGNDESDLHALKGKGKGDVFQGQCYHCGQHRHRVAECRKKNIEMMTGKGSAKERTHHSNRCSMEKGTWLWKRLDME